RAIPDLDLLSLHDALPICEVLEGLCGAVGGAPPQGMLQGAGLGALGAQPRTRRAGAGVVDPTVLGRPAQNLQTSFGHRQTLPAEDRKSTRLNSSHVSISYA